MSNILQKNLAKQIFQCIFAYFVSSVNVIIRLMLSLLLWPKVITLSGFYCIAYQLHKNQAFLNSC